MSNATLKLELRGCLSEVRHQQEVMMAYHRERDENPFEMRLPSGDFVLAPFISAKAQLLIALAGLEK